MKSKQSGPKEVYWSKLQSVSFSNNRVHGCESGVYGEGEFGIVSNQLLPTVGGQLAKVSVVTTFDGITATRNRNRGIWLRPNWFSIKNARFAMNRDSAALVTAGGFDGASPGDWGLVSGSTFVGISLNNVDRFGPCPYPGVAGPGTKYNTGGRFGCIDNNSAANDIINQGYPPPEWNMAGYYTYDGPARIFNDRFVNFIANLDRPIAPYITAQDQTYLDWYISSGRMGQHANKYEGDAAIGWFNSNQSSYPVSTTFDHLIFENVDLRHQIFTDLVNFAKFNDGDKNTAIVDRDGSLTGFSIVGGGMTQPDDIFPVSLNDLPFNAASNAVAECHSTGAQNMALEGRPSSLISPGDIGSLELEAQWPYPTRKNPNDPAFHFQWIKFANDATFNGEHQTEFLYGRNGLGIWEPKITSGYGYTISIPAAPPPGADPNDPQPKQAPGDPPAVAGIPHIVDIGLTDARVARVPGTHAPKPFFVRLGICYGTAANNNGATLKDSDFEVERGYRSWGGGLGGSTLTDTELNKYWNVNKCHNLDEQINKEPSKNYIQACPSGALVPPNPSTTLCDPDGVLTNGMCKYVKKPLTAVDCSALAGSGPTADKFCYNKDTGWLYLYMAQKTFNAEGPSPVGDCTASNHVGSCTASCPAGQYQSPADCTCSTFNPCPNPNQAKDGFGFGETYYSCPNEGCGEYRVRVKPSANYEPGPSTCVDPYQNTAVPAPQPTPATENMLAVGSTPVVPSIKIGTDSIPYADPVPTPDCSAGQPTGNNPPWSGGVITPNLASFQINNNGAKPAMVNITNQVVYPVIQDIQFVAADLAIGGTYTLNATRAGTPCQSTFTTSGTAVSPQYTASSMNNGCNIAPLNGGAIITLP